jgi:hypothetical protein
LLPASPGFLLGLLFDSSDEGNRAVFSFGELECHRTTWPFKTDNCIVSVVMTSNIKQIILRAEYSPIGYFLTLGLLIIASCLYYFSTYVTKMMMFMNL